MTEHTPQELLAALTDLLAKATTPTTPTTPITAPTPSGWAEPRAVAPPAAIQGVGVPVKVRRGRGILRVTFWLGPECAASPAALNAALDQLEDIGVPIDVWEPKDNDSWSGGSRSGRR